MSLLFWKRPALDVQALKDKCQNECLNLENYHRFLVELDNLPKAGTGTPEKIVKMIAIATGITKSQARQINLKDAVEIYSSILKRNDIMKMLSEITAEEVKKKAVDHPVQDPHSTVTSTPSV